MRLETLGAMAALAAAILAVEQRGSASTFGLVLTYALQITMLTSITVRFFPPKPSLTAEPSYYRVNDMREESLDDRCAWRAWWRTASMRWSGSTSSATWPRSIPETSRHPGRQAGRQLARCCIALQASQHFSGHRLPGPQTIS